MKILKEDLNLPLDNIYNNIGYEIVLIGDPIRKVLFKKNRKVVDFMNNFHLDILIKSSEKDFNKIIKHVLKNLKFKHMGTAFKGKIDNYNIEIIGFLNKKNESFDIFGIKNENRPDSSIEKIGISNKGCIYDQSGIGFSDFEKKIVRINPNSNFLWMGKIIKIISLAFQLNFKIEKNSFKKINKFIENLQTKKLRRIPYYNKTIIHNRTFPFKYDKYGIAILLKVLYMRVPRGEENKITNFLKKDIHPNFLKIIDNLSISLEKFEKESFILKLKIKSNR